jgi:hypothetical protein
VLFGGDCPLEAVSAAAGPAAAVAVIPRRVMALRPDAEERRPEAGTVAPPEGEAGSERLAKPVQVAGPITSPPRPTAAGSVVGGAGERALVDADRRCGWTSASWTAS